MTTVCAELPVRIVSEANRREHWHKVAARKQAHRKTALLILQQYARPMGDSEQISVTLTRIAPRKLDDDNLQSGFKATRDGVADWIGIDDGSPRLQWSYSQRTGRAKQYSAEVTVTWSDHDATD